ncbi:hypothetical protein R5H30_21480 [Sulfitobacter sp. D35]|uniref:hypothetical protein n=1 Tax=Sulfitobacter sp. D35 TaxID=3083252 RepID=UPI00296FB979|nr:hypothetical protein [Sulfitobacter sp. D35]MDW4500569.1 hypothetical protein [Sulfitobacter sp. D35]
MSDNAQKPDLTDLAVIRKLPERTPPHWMILEYCRHLGIQKPKDRPVTWLARVRRKDGGYTQYRLAVAIDSDRWVTKPERALALAREWFDSTGIRDRASSTKLGPCWRREAYTSMKDKSSRTGSSVIRSTRCQD